MSSGYLTLEVVGPGPAQGHEKPQSGSDRSWKRARSSWAGHLGTAGGRRCWGGGRAARARPPGAKPTSELVTRPVPPALGTACKVRVSLSHLQDVKPGSLWGALLSGSFCRQARLGSPGGILGYRAKAAFRLGCHGRAGGRRAGVHAPFNPSQPQRLLAVEGARGRQSQRVPGVPEAPMRPEQDMTRPRGPMVSVGS